MMRHKIVILASALLWHSCDVSAQNYTFSDIDCSQSRIAPLPGGRCRVTDTYSAAQTGGGLFRIWQVLGKNRYLNVIMDESLVANSYITSLGLLEAYLRHMDSRARAVATLVGPSRHGDSDYYTYTATSGEECVGFRRYGPSSGLGYVWVLGGVACEERGRTLSQDQIRSFIDSVQVRPAGALTVVAPAPPPPAKMLAGGEWALGRWEGGLSRSTPSGGADSNQRPRTLIIQKSGTGAVTCLWFISNDPNSRQSTKNCTIGPDDISLETAAESLVELRRSGHDVLHGRFMPAGSMDESQVHLKRTK